MAWLGIPAITPYKTHFNEMAYLVYNYFADPNF
jgi:hypothetical protein